MTQLEPMMEDVKKNGVQAMFKYMNDPAVMGKLSGVMGSLLGGMGGAGGGMPGFPPGGPAYGAGEEEPPELN
eukprot:CAMPEP_0197542586 /NCGR_PEP_ID=MMETSP1318-20131121/67784_1 /TAXON_ID=552666 /ORGANISM="Partenskyella glossopodia, Strain RCC365" /LENGTH=71 /DNA_ID=CAMNT_0043101861 /DNA_START=134 /DNA_END=349 /DNA_ORIENTATION=+